MTFSVLFWNIWLDNQIKGEAGSARLMKELEYLIEKYDPDVIGLTEVLQATHSDSPFVLDFLGRHGYPHRHYASASPLDDDWNIGMAVCSRFTLENVDEVVIGKDSPAEQRGYSGHEHKCITATITLPEQHMLNTIIAHPHHLRPHTIRDHYEGTRNIEKLLRSSKFSENTVLVGDFNEPGFMPKAFKNKVADVMKFRTGSIAHPTWRHNGYRFTPIRANLDQLYWSRKSNFELTDFEVIDSPVSDHRPLFAKFQYLTK